MAGHVAVLTTSNGAALRGRRGSGRGGPRRTGRRAALRVVCALWTLAAAAAGLIGVASCADNRDFDTCTGWDGPDAALQIVIADPLLASAQVTTSGACTLPTCVEPIDAGCTEWWAQVTGGGGTACLVALTTPEGHMLTKQVDGGSSCDKPLGSTIEF